MPTELLQGGAIFKGLRDTWILDYWIAYESYFSVPYERLYLHFDEKLFLRTARHCCPLKK